MILGRLILVGRDKDIEGAQLIAVGGAGLVAGLATAFCSSIWFSAVEGEVYAMSTFFTTLTLWSTIKWYDLPDSPKADRWILFTVFATGLSIGVHLLSLLTFPALALFIYFKKSKEHTLFGMALATIAGVAVIVAVQSLIITGIPYLWSSLELFTVNTLGMGFHTGLIPTFLLVAGIIGSGLYYVHNKSGERWPLYLMGALVVLAVLIAGGGSASGLLKLAILAGAAYAAVYNFKNVDWKYYGQLILVGATLVVIGYSVIGVVVIRANTHPPINMNAPTDVMRLIPYINREQYGERALLRGPHFESQPTGTNITERYGRVGDHYEIVDQKISYEYKNSDKMLFPRMGDYSQSRPSLYKRWMGLDPGKPLPRNRPNQADNISFLVQYQLGWMYWRYFMWNFSGRQNGDQGFFSWDKSSGHWISGIPFVDNLRLFDQSQLPDTLKNNKARNKYYMLPFLFGLLGLLFHFQTRSNDAIGLMALFVITGIGIIIYSNQPPNEPRERDYVLVGSFFTYCIWIGMGVIALFQIIQERAKLSGSIAAIIASGLVLIAPLLMGFQNFDDHSRLHHSGARDYANNFLESCEPNAIIFTYGDNDTYPLWYAQEVEGIRTDVRVVNLSLIAVDWYIDLLRRQINDSPPIKMTIPREAYRGKKRNQTFYYNPSNNDRDMSIKQFLKYIGEKHPLKAQSGRELESHLPTRKVYIPIDPQKALSTGMANPTDTGRIVSRIPLNLRGKEYLIKDELAILDVVGSNINDRPVYFAVTCRQEKLFGLADYMQLEGLGLRIIPVKSQSETQAYGIIGSGRVDADAVYRNVMEKFRWGNFDKEELFVDKSFAPSVQSHQLTIRRAAFEFLERGEKEKALELIDKFFEVFPHKNFPYDYRAFYMISVYLQAEAYDRAKPHLEILANETAEALAFYYSLNPDILDSSYDTDFRLADRTMRDVLDAATRSGDTEFEQKMKDLFAPYQVTDQLD